MERRAVSKVVVVLAVVVLAVGVGVPALVGNASGIRDRLPVVFERKSAAATAQSSSQISELEFALLRSGLSTSRVRARVGEPEATSEAEVERRRIECWYYGIADGTGAFQLCFANGRLASKRRY